MKLIHLADLHLGRRLHEFPLLEDQRIMLESVSALCRRERADALIIAGDVFDRAIPSVEAIRLFDDFLVGLAKTGTAVLAVAGNHDSGERLAFGRTFFSTHDIHIAGVFDGKVNRVVLSDDEGPVTFHLLPFIRPADVRRHFPEKEPGTATEAVRTALSTIERGEGRQVLITHQFVTCRGEDPLRSDSEVLQIGLADEVDASLFHGFDYVALGHLHRFQRVGPGPLYYAGSPLPYSFSEAGQAKGALLVDLGGGQEVQIRQLPLDQLRDMRRIRGSLEDLIDRGREQERLDDPARFDYLEVTLTDPGAVADPMKRLRQVYPHVMRLLFDRGSEDGNQDALISQEDFRTRDLASLFSDFFFMQTGRPLTGEQSALVRDLADRADRPEEAGL